MELLLARYGDYDKPIDTLTQEGRNQIELLAKCFYSLGFIPTFGVCKDNNRSYQSTRLLVGNFGLVSTDNRLKYPNNISFQLMQKLEKAFDFGENLRFMTFGDECLSGNVNDFTTPAGATWDLVNLWNEQRERHLHEQGVIVLNEYIAAGFRSYITRMCCELELIRYVNWYESTREGFLNKDKFMGKLQINGEYLIWIDQLGRVEVDKKKLLNNITNNIT